jgi:hypothetical protein
VARCKYGELHATVVKQRIGSNQKCVDPPLREASKHHFKIPRVADCEDFQLPRDDRGGRLHFCDHGLGKRTVRINQQGKASVGWHQFMQYPESLCHDLRVHGTHPSDVATRPIEVRD